MQFKDETLYFKRKTNIFKALDEYITNMLGINTDLSGVDVFALAANEDIIRNDKNFITTRCSFMVCLEICGSYPYNIYQTLTSAEQDDILLDSSKLVLKFFGKVDNLVANRDYQ